MSTLQTVRRVGNHHPAPVTASAPRGGQASGPGLFGLTGRRLTVRCEHVPAAPAQARQGDDQPRRVGGLSFGQRRALIQARVAVGAANFFARAAGKSAPDEFDGYGLDATRTPAMQRAAAESAAREEQEWRELADLAAQPEWDLQRVED